MREVACVPGALESCGIGEEGDEVVGEGFWFGGGCFGGGEVEEGEFGDGHFGVLIKGLNEVLVCRLERAVVQEAKL